MVAAQTNGSFFLKDANAFNHFTGVGTTVDIVAEENESRSIRLVALTKPCVDFSKERLKLARHAMDVSDCDREHGVLPRELSQFAWAAHAFHESACSTFLSKRDIKGDAKIGELLREIVSELQKTVPVGRVRDSGAPDRATKTEELVADACQGIVMVANKTGI